jgi:hypothetical protein
MLLRWKEEEEQRRKMTNRRNVMDGKVIKSLNAREL